VVLSVQSMNSKSVDFIKIMISDFWATVAEMSPYLLFGFFVAGIISVFVSQSLVERHLGGKGIWPLLKASLFGIPLPLCSCSVIPVSMSLRKHGASKGATISFLLSTPQTGVDSIFVTLSLLGPVLAVFRPLVALVTGLIGGTFVNLFDRSTDESRGSSDEGRQTMDERRFVPLPSSFVHRKLIRGLKYGFITLPRDIGTAMLVGLVIAAVISTVMPDDFFAEKLLGTGIFAMVVMMFLGIPIYVCATASVPIAAALISKGLTPGAALVFLITGPATNAAGLTTIWKVLGWRTAVAYLSTVVVCALGSGILLDMMFPELSSSVQAHMHQMKPSILGYISAVALLAVLAIAILNTRKTDK
jgi:uncharacterized membrane protein YraQ (UPF0718 family)